MYASSRTQGQVEEAWSLECEDHKRKYDQVGSDCICREWLLWLEDGFIGVKGQVLGEWHHRWLEDIGKEIVAEGWHMQGSIYFLATLITLYFDTGI